MALIQSDWYTHKRRKFEHTEYTQDAPAEERPRADIAGRRPSTRKSKKRASGETNPQILGLELQASRTIRKFIVVD